MVDAGTLDVEDEEVDGSKDGLCDDDGGSEDDGSGEVLIVDVSRVVVPVGPVASSAAL